MRTGPCFRILPFPISGVQALLRANASALSLRRASPLLNVTRSCLALSATHPAKTR